MGAATSPGKFVYYTGSGDEYRGAYKVGLDGLEATERLSRDMDEVQAAVVQAQAVARLRSAIAAGSGVPDAVRLCVYEHPAFGSALLTAAVRRLFGPGADIREISRFAGRIAWRKGAEAAGFPQREVEAVIRAIAAEAEYFEFVDPALFSYAEFAIAVVSGFFADRPDPGDGMSLVEEALRVEAATLDLRPGLGEVVEDWYREGMHDSPMAWPDPRGVPGDRGGA